MYFQSRKYIHQGNNKKDLSPRKPDDLPFGHNLSRKYFLIQFIAYICTRENIHIIFSER